MDNLVPTILLLSLCSPIAELFPNIFMSRRAPENNDIQGYLDAWKRRVIIVMIVWLPILFTLSKILDNTLISLLLVILVFSAFGLRLCYFDRALHQELKNKDEKIIEPSSIPEAIYFVVFTSIGVILYTHLIELRWLVPVAILLIFFGASMMSKYRRGRTKNLTYDIFGRVIFTVGFLFNLFNLVRAVAIL